MKVMFACRGVPGTKKKVIRFWREKGEGGDDDDAAGSRGRASRFEQDTPFRDPQRRTDRKKKTFCFSARIGRR